MEWIDAVLRRWTCIAMFRLCQGQLADNRIMYSM